MTKVGIVIVSHSKYLAQGIVDLITEVASDVSISFVGGTEDGGIGTSFEQVEQIVSGNSCEVLLGFYDLGSARMMLDMVVDFSDKNLLVQQVPIVEGAYAAAALLQAGADLETVLKELDELRITK